MMTPGMIRRNLPVALSVSRRSVCLALAAMAVFVAAILPACGVACCALEQEASMHAEMPCCESPSLAPTDSNLPAVKAAVPLQVLAPIVAESSAPVAPHVHVRVSEPLHAHAELSPPLFLLNAQFLI
jgi:hypothetical protein